MYLWNTLAIYLKSWLDILSFKHLGESTSLRADQSLTWLTVSRFFGELFSCHTVGSTLHSHLTSWLFRSLVSVRFSVCWLCVNAVDCWKCSCWNDVIYLQSYVQWLFTPNLERHVLACRPVCDLTDRGFVHVFSSPRPLYVLPSVVICHASELCQ